MITVGVKIIPKEEVLDVQGRAILTALQHKGNSVQDCQCGKFLKLKVDIGTEKEALEHVRKIAESILCNRLVEQYELEILSS